MPYIVYGASFDGNDLTTVPGLTVLATKPYTPPKRKVNLAKLASSNKSKANSGFYEQRTIPVKVGIARATRDLVETSLDLLFGMLQGLEKTLELRQSGAARRYTCSYIDTEIDKEGGSYIELWLFFETSDHFGYDAEPTLLLQVSGFTSGQKTDQINVGGSAPWQQPTITITLSSITGTGTRNVTVGNGSTGQAISINRTWASGDVIEISAPNQSVTVNGVDVAFSGALPEWQKGIGYITYSDTFTARTMSNRVVYTKRYV